MKSRRGFMGEGRLRSEGIQEEGGERGDRLNSFCSMVSLHKVPTRLAWESETGPGQLRAVP